MKRTDQTDSDGDIIWFVQETGDTLEKEKVKRVTGDAFDNEDTGKNEDNDGSKNSGTAHDTENFGVTREEAEVRWVIRNAVDDGEMMKQDEAPKNGEDIKKELTSAADIKDDPEDDGSSVEDDREHFFQGEGFEDTRR